MNDTTDTTAATIAVDEVEVEVDNFTNDSAMMIAWERSLESELPVPLFSDPLAKTLAGSKGEKLSANFGNMCTMFEFEGWPEFHKTWVAVRTRYIDDRIKEISSTHINQVVNLGAGMDTRPFRMECFSDFTIVVDVDMPVINQGKRKVFEGVLNNPKPYCAVETVDLNFLDEETLSTVLSNTRFDSSAPTIFIAEGLIMYLGAIGKLKLIKDVSTVAAPGSVFVLQFMDASESSAAKDNPTAVANALSVAEATKELNENGWEQLKFSKYGDKNLNFGRYPDKFKPSASFSFCVCRKQ